MARCSACDGAIVWCETPAGERQPFDRDPDPKGNRILLGRGPSRPPLAIPATTFEPHNPTLNRPAWVDECLYMPHHATCPNADQFRKKAQ